MSLIHKPQAGVAQPVRKQVIQKSIYENPSVTLDLIAKICAAQPSNSQEDFYSRYRSVTYRLKDSTKQSKNNSSWNDSTANDNNSSSGSLIRLLRKSEIASLLFNRNFSKDYQESLNEVVQLLEKRQSTNYIHVVLAGGFSSGKSSFLNRLVKNANLLPTGTQPISVVKTYLYCNAKNKKVTVEGVNLKNVLVKLPTNVLQAIQHANSSNVHLASVLEKLLIQIKSSELDGLCFIDTPGYNNSISTNVSNGKTDKDTATEAFAEGDVLFWLIDIDKGTAISDDIEMLAQFKGKPKVIIFNKADKKGYQESKKIVEEAYHLLPKYFDMNEIIDILAFSSLDNKILFSRHHTGLPGLLSDIRKRSHKSSPLNRAKQNIHNLFQTEIREQEEKIMQISDRIRLLKGEKDTAYRNQNRHQSDNEGLIDYLKDVIKVQNTFLDNVVEVFNELCGETYWYSDKIININNSKWNTHDEINEKCSNLRAATNEREKKIDSILQNTSYYKDRILDNFVKNIVHALNQGSSKPSDYYQQLKELDNTLQQERQQREALKELLVRASKVYEAAIDAGIKYYLQKQSSTSLCITDKVVNIFDAIEQRDFNGFLCSFQDGVDLSICNKQGFTPLTYAVHHGNVAMVKFFLDHNADCAGLDKRGCNALHTAIQVGSKHICEMLLQHNSMLCTIPARLPNGQTQSIQDLLNQSNFTQWAQQALV
ncbi:ankyrin repeat domain-containing protein [Alloprevotella sp. oral taxon 473]|jgi:hypothetical protein|uniref:ankyrin repeat domain-containing protein n=1 Tax=Alloprevotella sp. oral taxon 473 TaxID=712469 RepID=UPI0002A3E23D|nr:ankyrin repeat domain-containing protein [Alloprevotella sp. oral taxon 473]EKX90753.1 ankyrin repeat protein [Alloprevotella sp. oral taxon 473 str. F0040]